MIGIRIIQRILLQYSGLVSMTWCDTRDYHWHEV